MNLRRGCRRVGFWIAAMYVVFWTFAYVLTPVSALKPGPASFAARVTAWRVLAPCLVTALALGAWAAAGFRSD
jgi:hypothetical protein